MEAFEPLDDLEELFEDIEAYLESGLQERDAYYEELATEHEDLLKESIAKSTELREQMSKIYALERDLEATRDQLRRTEDVLHLREFKASLGFRDATCTMIGAGCCYMEAGLIFSYASDIVIHQNPAQGWFYLVSSVMILLVAIYASFKTLQIMEINSPDLQVSQARTQPTAR